MNRITVNQGDSLAAKLTTANTSYEMSGAIDLSGGTLTVPPNCTLKFEEGTKITNGTIVLNNTVFEGAKHSIRTIVSGTQYELDTDDFDLTDDDKADIMQSIVNTATVIQLHGKLEDVFENITIENDTEFTNSHVEKPKTFVGNGATIVNDFTSEVAAIYIKTDDLIRITDINFEIAAAGWAIKKDTIQRQEHTRLSFIIDRCRFIRTAASNQGDSGLIRLINSREGNITNCMFVSKIEYRGIGIDRSNAINTNVIGCMFSDLKFGIYAKGEHINGNAPQGDENDKYTSYACGLNIQSAVMLGCEYGIYIEGNDSFFLNNSMIDFCVYPLVIYSQDGANITNNYFSSKAYQQQGSFSYSHSAVITVRNNNTSGFAQEKNKRIIILGNTLYAHRTTVPCHGLDMDVYSTDCIIQSNTFGKFKEHGILLKKYDLGNDLGWTTEKLVIDNNRFHFMDSSSDAIGGYNYTGGDSVFITNNFVMETGNTKFVNAGTSYFGNYLSFGNHDYAAIRPDNGGLPEEVYNASRINNSRMKLDLTMGANATTLSIDNPMPGEQNLVVYIANNLYPIKIVSINSQNIVFGKSITSTDASFTAIVERKYNM